MKSVSFYLFSTCGFVITGGKKTFTRFFLLKTINKTEVFIISEGK